MKRTVLFTSIFALLMLSAASFGYIAGNTAAEDDASCTSMERAKPGTYKGTMSGPLGTADVTMVVKGKNVSGNMKGKVDGGGWVSGVSGTITKGDISASGANPGQNTSLLFKGSVCGNKIMGTMNGKALAKEAWYMVNISKTK